MLTIRDAGGNDVSRTPPAEITVLASGSTVKVGIFCVVAEDDPDLPFDYVGADLDWNDGTRPVHFPAAQPDQISPLTINASRGLAVGTYAITVSASNRRVPVPDTAKATFMVTVKSLKVAPVNQNLVFGPILPRDSGNPSPQTWIFNTASDLLVLESSVRMLLLTTKGERIMQPGYGTSLKKILFELNVDSIESIIQQEITQALNIYEPRVAISGVDIDRSAAPRTIAVRLSFLSKLQTQPFDINLQLEK